MTIPLDPTIAHWLDQQDENTREYFQERAAILEYDAGLPRATAEATAQAWAIRYLKHRVQSHDRD